MSRGSTHDRPMSAIEVTVDDSRNAEGVKHRTAHESRELTTDGSRKLGTDSSADFDVSRSCSSSSFKAKVSDAWWTLNGLQTQSRWTIWSSFNGSRATMRVCVPQSEACRSLHMSHRRTTMGEVLSRHRPEGFVQERHNPCPAEIPLGLRGGCEVCGVCIEQTVH